MEIIWEGIKFASTASKTFDFEGSMIEGIESFFRQFGATPTVYYQIRKQNIALEIFEFIKPTPPVSITEPFVKLKVAQDSPQA